LTRPDKHTREGPEAAARKLGEHCEWQSAYELLCAADAAGELDAAGLELLAECARWVGQHGRVVELFERAHHAHAIDSRGAVRTALSLCYTHMDACEPSPAASWWQRADELIVGLAEGPEHGLHAWFAGRARGEAGDLEGHQLHAQRALEIAQRFGDRNVEALALIDLGHVATARGQTARALELLDRATALALGGEIGVLETGLVYCNAIFACRARGDWDRAQQWTHSASRWVARVQVSYFPGLCRIHRAEVLRVRGELAAAESEALEAVALLEASIPRWTAMAHVELGEVRRRRGDLTGAIQAFARALGAGWDPQPGLALVMLAQGDAPAAHRAIERFCKGRVPTLLCGDRSGLLRARVTIAIAADELETAGAALAELVAQATGDSLPWDRAACAQAQGEVAVARGDTAEAIDHLHHARSSWAELDAPYELASAGLLLAQALATDGQALGATLEFEAARGILARLGATPDRVISEELFKSEDRPPPPEATPPSSARGLAAPAEPGRAVLRREGDYWSLEFDDASLRLRDGKGLAYLARLLACPGREILALELAGVAGGAAPDGDAGELLDGDARTAYRARLADLQAELEEAARLNDLALRERCRAEMDVLTAQLSAAVGLGGRARRAGDPNERARQSVTKALRGVIRKVADQHEPLGRYLSNTIRTGTTCCFDPDPGRPASWRIEA